MLSSRLFEMSKKTHVLALARGLLLFPGSESSRLSQSQRDHLPENLLRTSPKSAHCI